jgi:hypothetical protein
MCPSYTSSFEFRQGFFISSATTTVHSNDVLNELIECYSTSFWLYYCVACYQDSFVVREPVGTVQWDVQSVCLSYTGCYWSHTGRWTDFLADCWQTITRPVWRRRRDKLLIHSQYKVIYSWYLLPKRMYVALETWHVTHRRLNVVITGPFVYGIVTNANIDACRCH